MTVESSAPEVPAEFAAQAQVVRVARPQALAQQLKGARPDAVVFDFDYPDKTSLGLAASLKEEHPSVPMVLLTVQHSEALAVWSFRARFMDFLVRPVVSDDVNRCLALLDDIAVERRAQTYRHAPASIAPIPAEVPAAIGRAGSLQPALHYIEKNLGSRIVAEDVARLCRMSPFRFSRAFREAFGVNFREYVLKLRLNEAARLLENPQAPVTHVASAVGFNDMSYFSRMFKREFGTTPSAAQVSSPGKRSTPKTPELVMPASRRRWTASARPPTAAR